MSLTYDQITSITEKFFLKKLADNVYDSNALIRRFSRPDKLKFFDGGTKIIAPVINSKPSSGGYYTDLDALSTDRSDDITAAEFDWKQLYEPVRISRLELLKNSGDRAQLSLIASKTKIAEKQMKENLALGLFSDGTSSTGALSGDQITGLAACISTSSTYGGIAVADFAGWAAISKANSGTDRAISFNLMQSTFGAASEDDDKPTVAVMKQNVYDEVYSLFQPHQRLVSKEMESLGFKGVLEWNGIPLLVDSHAKANAIYMLNENYIFLGVHPKENMRKETLEKLETSNSLLMRVFWMGNLVCNNRRFQAELADIEVAS